MTQQPVVEITELACGTLKLKLLHFGQEVQQEEIRAEYKRQNLRGLTQDEWKLFVENHTDQLPEDARNGWVALMYTGQRGDWNKGGFPETVCYNHQTNTIEIIPNWAKRYWETDFWFLFAEKSPE